MPRRRPWLLALAVLVAGALAAGLAWRRSARPPNLLLVTVDTLRADALGCYGERRIATAAFDRLAGAGTRFAAAFAPAPLTLPSHASLLTGRYPDEHGVWNNGTFALPPGEVTLAEVLHSRGYATAAFAASFIVNRDSGLGQGFDHFLDVTLDNSFEHRQPLERHGADVVADALAWLGSPAAREPFFLWVHLYDPHVPYEPAPGLRPSGLGEPLASYLGEVAQADRALGQLLDGLGRDGRLRRTVVAVTSDHGESLGEHGEATHGYFLYDAVLRVPLLIAGPAVPAGRVVDEPVQLEDLMPTLLGLVGQPVPETASGLDLRPALAPVAAPLGSRPLYAANLVPWLQLGFCPLRAVRFDGHKYIDAPRPELYDLAADPAETRDLGALPAARARSAALKDRLDRLLAAMKPGAGAGRAISPEEEESLRSLVYLAGSGDRQAAAAGACSGDPKDGYALQHELVGATFALLRGRPGEAADRLGAVLAGHPDLHEARHSRARALAALGRLDEARAELDTIVERAAHDPAMRARAQATRDSLGAAR